MDEVLLVDSTLRDGAHAVEYSFTPDDVRTVVTAIASAGVKVIEVTHGDGLGGSSLHFGRGAHSDEVLVGAAVEAAQNADGEARIAVLCVPGLGTVRDIEAVAGAGAEIVRVATHVTEADTAQQTVLRVQEMGLTPFGFLMMVHKASIETLVENAKLMESYGVEALTLADSAGHLLPDDVLRRIDAVTHAVDIPVGVHTHNNLGMAEANALRAVEAGARCVDGTILGLGAGAGNAQSEVLAAVFERQGYVTGIDVDGLLAASDLATGTSVGRGNGIVADAIRTANAGLYSSFLLPARRAAAEFGVGTDELLRVLGERSLVAGQEDMIVDVAVSLSSSR